MKKKKKNYLSGHISARLKQILTIMKISLLLFILELGTLKAGVFSQTVKINLSLQNVSLKEAINNIEKQTYLKFLYRSDLVDLNKTTSIETKETTIDDLMASLLKGTQIGYNLLGENLIVLTPIQQLKVSGIVSDATTGETLIGVSIVVKGSSTGNISDAEGKFTIDVPDPNAVLVFSYIGYTSQEVPLAGQSNIDVKLTPDIKALNEVVVVGYGTQKKADLTGSVSVVSSKDIDNTAVLDPLQALQGKAAGVNITSVSGQPGAGYQIRIRGTQSINASNDPIYVIDGVISEDMNSINTYDIESISILKDGASSAIYGARAANGVVLITTKHGRKNEAPVISFHTYQGIQTQPNTKLTLLNSDQWLKLNKESLTNDGLTGTDLSDALGYTDADLAIYKDVNGSFRSTDWLKQIERTGKMSYYDLSVSGGNEKSTYFTSLSYLDQDGMIKSQAAKKINFRFNSEHSIKKFIEFGNTLNLYDNNNEGLPDFTAVNSNFIPNPYLQAFRKSPLSEVTEPDGSYGINQNQNVEYLWAPPTVFTDLYKRKISSYGVIGNVYAKFNILKGLSFTPRLSLTYQHFLYSFYIPAIVLTNTTDVQSQSSLQKNSVDNYHVQIDYMLNYDRSFNKHNISLLAAYTEENAASEDLGGFRSNIPLTTIYYLNAGDPSTQTNNNGYSAWSIASYIGRINYDYDGKYLLQATVRRDGVSRFSPDNRWSVFPSFSAGWRISKEKFFAKISNVVNDFKIRASSGALGNANIGNYPTYAALTAMTAILNQQQSGGFSLDNAINKDVKWEATRKNNFGIDASLFQSKFYLTVDYFISNTTDLLYQKPLPLSAGKNGNAYVNGGEFQNKGWEFELGFREKRGDFSYDISTNFTAMRNKVIDLAGQDLRSQGTVVGQPYNSFFGLSTSGIIKTPAQLATYQSLSPDAQLGDVMFKDIDSYDVNGKLTGKPDGVIDGADRTFIGKRYPDLAYGFVANVSYKRFSFQIQTQGLKGIDLPFTGVTLPYFGGAIAQNASSVILQRWNATDNPDGNLPRLTRNDKNGNQSFSDIWLSDASYFKISNINISYNLPSNICQKMLIKELNIYASIQNLHTYTKYKGGDPDVTFSGDAYVGGNPADKIPQPRTWILGLRLSL